MFNYSKRMSNWLKPKSEVFKTRLFVGLCLILFGIGIVYGLSIPYWIESFGGLI